MSDKKRLIVNTGALYLKMIYSIAVSLYTTRLILAILGVEDYGIYTLIAGTITLLSFLNVSMTIATQRFMSLAIGANNLNKLQGILSTSITLHLIIASIVVLLLEIGGVFLFDGFLNIPESRLSTAKIVYQFMTISTFFTISAVPYDATINAHEKMWIDSLIGFVETTVKLFIALLLFEINSDKLLMYSFLTMLLIILMRVVKSAYCFKAFDECRNTTRFWKSYSSITMKDMLAFAGWNTFGAIVIVGKNQFMSVMLNLFYGAVMNASFGIASQVNSQVVNFSTTLLKAINPQIIKSEGSGNRLRMLKMATYTSKFSFLLFSFFLIPLLIEMPYVIFLWLHKLPEFSVVFCQIFLISTLILQFSNGIMIAMQSVGKISMYTISVSLVYLLNIPIAAFLLFIGYPPYVALICSLISEVISLIVRMIVADKIIDIFSIPIFLKNVILKCSAAFIVTLSFAIIPTLVMEDSFIRLLTVTLTSSILLIMCIRYIALSNEEVLTIKSIITKVQYKILKK